MEKGGKLYPDNKKPASLKVNFKRKECGNGCCSVPGGRSYTSQKKSSLVQVGCCNLPLWRFVAFLLLGFDSNGVRMAGTKTV